MSPCQDCHAGCCRSFAVPVTGADILRVERLLGLGFWDFVCRWEDREGQITQGYAPQFYFEDEPKTPFAICLQQHDSAAAPGTMRCEFLAEEMPSTEFPLGRAHCSIHGARPQACRVFPTKLAPSGKTGLIYDVPEKGRDSDNPIFNLCARPWTEADVDPIQAMHDLIIMQYEMSFFHVIANAWNRNPQPWELFPNYLHAIYEQRMIREQEPEPIIVPFPQTATAPAMPVQRRRAG